MSIIEDAAKLDNNNNYASLENKEDMPTVNHERRKLS